jgi:mono/diheme cytochrome c family protein
MNSLRHLLAAPLLFAAFSACAAGAQEDYILYCMGCHGPAGAGVPGKVPPLAGSLARFMRSAEGREYLTRVPGAANSPISDAQLAAVLNWAAQRFCAQDWNEATVAFTGAEVAAHRHHPLADVSARRQAIVSNLQATGPAPPALY